MSRIANPSLPEPPEHYDKPYFVKLLRQLQLALSASRRPGPVTAASDKTRSVVPYDISALTLVDLPTSATGLPPNSVWNDGGTLKITS